MPIFDRLDPELAAVVALKPVMEVTDIHRARALRAELFARLPTFTRSPRIEYFDRRAPGRGESPDVGVRVFRPSENSAPLPCLFWTQGGGYILTAQDLDDRWCEQIAETHQCVVVSVDWRRAPEHPFPAAADDCYSGLSWVFDNAAELNVDTTRIAVGGHSSGGGSTASLALMVRDRREYSLAHQLLIYPMIDDTNTTTSSQMVTDATVWNRASNEYGWRCYLGDAYGSDDVSPYAAPTRMKDLKGVAPASILTGELDLFVDENLAYAQRLMHAGVPTEVHVYPGAHHGFDRDAPDATVSRRLLADRDAILGRVFER